MTKYFFGFAKYFSRFRHNSWICKFVWGLQNNICGFNTFIKICNSFSDLINSSTMISKKLYDFKYFFGILKHFFGFRKYFGIVPYRPPYNSDEDMFSVQLPDSPESYNDNGTSSVGLVHSVWGAVCKNQRLPEQLMDE